MPRRSGGAGRDERTEGQSETRPPAEAAAEVSGEAAGQLPARSSRPVARGRGTIGRARRDRDGPELRIDDVHLTYAGDADVGGVRSRLSMKSAVEPHRLGRSARQDDPADRRCKLVRATRKIEPVGQMIAEQGRGCSPSCKRDVARMP